MNISINGRFLSQSTTGVQRFAREITMALDALMVEEPERFEGIQVRLLAPRSAHRLPTRILRQFTVGRFGGQLWEQSSLPLECRRDLLINFGNTAPVLHGNQIVVIHDAAVFASPEAYSTGFRLWYRFLLPQLGRTARHIVTVSEFSRQELMRWLRIDERDISIISESGEHIQRAGRNDSIVDALRGKPFVLAVSSLNPNKNFGTFVKAIEHLQDLRADFVIAGSANPQVFRSHARLELSQVKHLGFVTDEELRALYESATCFVFPSKYEGFGLPPLEAMTCGCPVVVADSSSLAEVCGESAIYFNPDDPSELAIAIRRVLEDPELRDTMSKQGLARSRQYSWRNAAIQLMELVQKVAK